MIKKSEVFTKTTLLNIFVFRPAPKIMPFRLVPYQCVLVHPLIQPIDGGDGLERSALDFLYDATDGELGPNIFEQEEDHKTHFGLVQVSVPDFGGRPTCPRLFLGKKNVLR